MIQGISKNRWIILLFFLCSNHLFAQNPQVIDSLLQVLETDISDREKVDTYVKVAYEYRNSDSTNTSEYATKAIRLAEKISYPEGKIDASLKIAWLNVIAGNYQKAESIYNQNIAYSERIDYKRGKSQGLNDLGIIYSDKGNYKKSLQYYTQALEISKSLEDKIGIATCYNNMAIIYMDQSNYNKALDYNFQALELRKELGDKKRVASSYNNIGLIYKSQGDFKKALEYYFHSLKIKEALNNQRGMASSYNNIGNLYTILGNLEKALYYARKTLEIDKAQGDKIGMAMSYDNIGAIYIKQGNYKEALNYSFKSLELYESIGANSHKSDPLLRIGENYKKQKKWMLAKKYLNKTIQLATEVGVTSNIQVAAEHLAIVEKELGNYQKAYEYHVLFKQMADSLKNEEQTEKLTRLEMNYEFEQEKDSIQAANITEVIILEKDIENRKITQFATFIGLGLTGLLLLVLFLFFQSKQRDNKLLKKQSQKLQESNEEIQVINEELLTANEEIQSTNDTLHLAYQELEKTTLEVKQQEEYISTLNKFLVQDLEMTSQNLLQKNQKLEEYAFYNSHRTRAPLARILGLISLIKPEKLDSDTAFMIEKLKENSEELDEIVKGMNKILNESDLI